MFIVQGKAAGRREGNYETMLGSDTPLWFQHTRKMPEKPSGSSALRESQAKPFRHAIQDSAWMSPCTWVVNIAGERVHFPACLVCESVASATQRCILSPHCDKIDDEYL